jgi:predicted DNA-binding transcriptional regulator AlpA
LSLPEAVIFTGRSASNLYKLVSQGKLPFSKPEGKMIYFERVKLEAWMLQNPSRTSERLSRGHFESNFLAEKAKKHG